MANVVIFLSDEENEDERETGGLFQYFLAKVEPFVDRNVVVLLSSMFDEAAADFIASSYFRTLLQRKIEVVRNNDAYIHTGEICRALRDNAGKEPPKPEICEPTTSNSCDVEIDVEIEREACNGDSSKKPRVTSTAGQFENGNKGSSSGEAPTSLPEAQGIDDDIVIVEIPSAKDFSTQTTGKPKAKSTNSHKILSPSKRRKVIRRLEEKMKHVSNQIRILNRAELSLDEMGMSDSTYIKECRLKERFNNIWNKICTMQGKPPNTGRVTEKEIKCPTTGYPVIDEDICKFMKNRKSFPDIFDVKEVINKANRKHDLRISAAVLKELAEEVFTSIGNKLQRRRKTDFNHNFGCFLTDDCEIERDPATNDPDLRRKLEKNQKKSKHALNKVFRKYVHYNRQKNLEGSQSPSHSPDHHLNDEDEKGRRRGKVTKNNSSHSSSDGSDSEPNESLSQPSQTIEQSDDSDNDDMPQSRQGRSTRDGNSSSDASDFESNGSFSQPGKKSIMECIDDSDQEKSSQEIISSSRPEPLASVTKGSETPKRKLVTISEEDAPGTNSIKDSRSSSQSTTNGSGTSSCKSQEASEDDHLANKIEDSESQVITIIDDADDESDMAVLPSQETNSSGVPCHANSPSLEREKAKECMQSLPLPVDVKQLFSVKQPEVAEKTVSLATNSSSGGPDANISSLICSVNIQPISLSEELRHGLNSPKTKTVEVRKKFGKRSAERDFSIYESPLKLFRKSTLALLQSEETSGKQIASVGTEQNMSLNGQVLSNTDHGKTSALQISTEPTDKNLTNSSTRDTLKKFLSLKRKRPNKKVSNGTQVAVIVLSDDDSD